MPPKTTFNRTQVTYLYEIDKAMIPMTVMILPNNGKYGTVCRTTGHARSVSLSKVEWPSREAAMERGLLVLERNKELIYEYLVGHRPDLRRKIRRVLEGELTS